MRNYVHPGDTLTLPAPYEVNSGDGIQVGAIFGIARTWAIPGEQVEVSTVGVFDMKKSPDQEWTIGDKLYWDDRAREITNVALDNSFIGVAADSHTNSFSEVGRVKIVGIAP